MAKDDILKRERATKKEKVQRRAVAMAQLLTAGKVTEKPMLLGKATWVMEARIKVMLEKAKAQRKVKAKGKGKGTEKGNVCVVQAAHETGYEDYGWQEDWTDWHNYEEWDNEWTQSEYPADANIQAVDPYPYGYEYDTDVWEYDVWEANMVDDTPGAPQPASTEAIIQAHHASPVGE